ncbi:glycoside hydrolase superfamily [Mycena rebaudengoi]|nr:glycoside hydrolase superfamily [Mycena rebaudengoi]
MKSLTTDDPTNITVSPDPSSLSQFVAAAQVNKIKAILSIGGCTGSQYYSRLVNTSASRTKFVNTVLGLVTTYTLDGIDFDWEYPGADPNKGLRCNERHLDDSANFLLFLQELRGRKEGKELILTAAKLCAEDKLHLILSLVIFLGVSIRALLAFIFETNILAVKDRASRFLGYTPSHDDPHLRFPPSHIFSIWSERCTSIEQRDQLREMITPLTHAIVLDESNQIHVKDLTIARMRELMQPGVLGRKYQDSSPFYMGFCIRSQKPRRILLMRYTCQNAGVNASASKVMSCAAISA